jgi:23S rRNA pseudouridine2605 synthase
MDDDRKNSRGKPPRATGAARPAKGGDGGKRFRKHTPPKPYEKGGEGFAKRGGDETRPARKAYAKRQEDAPQERARGERPEGRPWRERKDRTEHGGDARGGKPFAKRTFGERPQGEGGERKFVRREGAEGQGGDRKPFAKKPHGGPGERRDAEGRPQYWGKRPGKAEREALARGDSPESRSAGDERKPRRPAGEGGGFAKRDGEYRAKPFAGGDRPKRFDAAGNRPRPQGDRAERPMRDFKPRRADMSPVERASPARRDEAPGEEGERIAKRLARAGISSRRDAEELIAAGRVKVNGKVLASPAFNVSVKDRIELDGMEIPAIERTRLFLFHKPAGVVTTNRDPEGRKTVFDVLPQELPRLMTIGRLDINTEGLLLLTNDGGLSRVLELPATGWLRRYRVRVHGKVDEQALAGLKDGIAVDGVFYGAVEATLEREQGSNAWLTLGLREGKNREVKNILGALGLDVTRLIRVSYGPFQLGELPEGHVLEIKGRMLRDQLGERLVEESGANFDADIVKPFSNKPVRRGDDKPRREERPAREARPVIREGEGGLIKGKGFRRDREQHREDIRDRLSTKRPERGGYGGPDGFKRGEGEGREARFAKPDRAGGKPGFDKKPGFKSFGAKTDRGEGRDGAPSDKSARKTNVWMAPGARPQGQGRIATEKAEHLARKADKTGHRKSGAGKGGKPAFGKPRGERDERPRGDGPRGPRKGGPGADRRR